MEHTRVLIDAKTTVVTVADPLDFDAVANRIMAQGGELADIAAEISRLNQSLTRLSQRAQIFLTR